MCSGEFRLQNSEQGLVSVCGVRGLSSMLSGIVSFLHLGVFTQGVTDTEPRGQ